MSMSLRIGTRGSLLARAQTDDVIERLHRLQPDLHPEVVVIKTKGDEGYSADLGTDLDGKRAFTKGIEDALLEGRIDVAVHSVKDVPTEPVDGLEVAAFPPRADPRDVLVATEPRPLTRLRPGTRVGTSSLRRQAQLLASWKGLEIVELHGNVDTRLRRIADGEVDAIVVAAAGIDRLHLKPPYVERIDPEVMTPAPGQGALAVQTRSDDMRTKRIVRAIDDESARRAVEAERAVSHRIGGGCNVPFGALATIADGAMTLRAVVGTSDGRRLIRASVRCPSDDGTKAVDDITRLLEEQGAREIMGHRM